MCARTVCPTALAPWGAGCRHHSVKEGRKHGYIGWSFLKYTWEICWRAEEGDLVRRMLVPEQKCSFDELFIKKIFLLMRLFFLLLPLVRDKLEENTHFYACTGTSKLCQIWLGWRSSYSKRGTNSVVRRCRKLEHGEKVRSRTVRRCANRGDCHRWWRRSDACYLLGISPVLSQSARAKGRQPSSSSVVAAVDASESAGKFR